MTDRQKIEAFLAKTEAEFLTDWSALEPVDRVRFRLKLLEFVVPKQREHALSGGLQITWHEEKTYS